MIPDEKMLNSRAKAYARNCLGLSPKTDSGKFFIAKEAYLAGCKSVIKDINKKSKTA